MYAEINSDIARDAKELFAVHQCSIKSEFQSIFVPKSVAMGVFITERYSAYQKVS